MVVSPAGAVATGRLHALQVGAAELGEVAGVRVGHRGQAAAQRRGVELGRVGAALLQQLSVHVLAGLVDLGAAAAFLAQLAFALLAPGGARGGAAGRLLRPLGGGSFALRGGAAVRGAGPAAATRVAAAVVHAAAAAVVPQFARFGFNVNLDLHAVPVSETREDTGVKRQTAGVQPTEYLFITIHTVCVFL